MTNVKRDTPANESFSHAADAAKFADCPADKQANLLRTSLMRCLRKDTASGALTIPGKYAFL